MAVCSSALGGPCPTFMRFLVARIEPRRPFNASPQPADAAIHRIGRMPPLMGFCRSRERLAPSVIGPPTLQDFGDEPRMPEAPLASTLHCYLHAPFRTANAVRSEGGFWQPSQRPPNSKNGPRFPIMCTRRRLAWPLQGLSSASVVRDLLPRAFDRLGSRTVWHLGVSTPSRASPASNYGHCPREVPARRRSPRADPEGPGSVREEPLPHNGASPPRRPHPDARTRPNRRQAGTAIPRTGF